MRGATPRELDEAPRPMVLADVAQVRVGRHQIPVDDAIAASVDAIATFNLVGERQARRQVLDARIVELVRADQCRPTK